MDGRAQTEVLWDQGCYSSDCVELMEPKYASHSVGFSRVCKERMVPSIAGF